MTSMSSTTSPTVRVAIDVAKLVHQVLVELPNGRRRARRVANTKAEIDAFVAELQALHHPCDVAFEPTGDDHRPLAYLLGQAGFHLSLVSSIAVARTREALYNSWDKNDPKDAQVILHLLKNGTTQRYLDPLVTGHLDLQEMANTYRQVSLRKVRLQYHLVTHHLPLYFPEAERYLHSSRAEWFTQRLLFTPCPAAVRRYSKAAFIAAAHEQVSGRKVDKARWLADFYDTASGSLGLPVSDTSETIQMFRVVLEEYRALCQLRKRLESDVVTTLAAQPDFVRLQTLPGIGPDPGADHSRRGTGPSTLRLCASIPQVLRARSLHGAIGPVSWDDPSLETGQRAASLCILDGGHDRDPHAAKHVSPEV
jgi:transposase